MTRSNANWRFEMKKGLSLIELAQKIEANRSLKHDMIANTRHDLRVASDSDGTVNLHVKDQGSFPVLDLAHRQIGARTKIPATYYDRMLREAPQLLTQNVNHWFSDNSEDRMIRTLGGDCRAFLSNRFQRVENEQTAEVALPIIGEQPDVKIVSAEITDRRMYIQWVTPRIEGEVRKGDVVQCGGILSNSEVGHGALMVSQIAYRLICLNGMVIGDKFRKYHVGRRVEDNSELWAEDTIAADDNAVLLKMRDMIRAACDPTKFDQNLSKMRELASTPEAPRPSKAVEVLAQKIGATEGEKEGILASLIKGGDLSAWGFANAVTHQAHEAVTYDRAVEFETAGGKLLDLPAREWREILEAA